MRVAVYARYSSENQREASLEDQERLCRDEAHRAGYQVARVYQDAALSGSLTDEQRPGLQAMLRDAEAKAFDVLIVDDLSRLSRDQVSGLQILRRLEYWGIGFIARADGIDTLRNLKTSRFLSGIKGVMAEEFLRDLAEKTRRGLEGVARKGLSAGGLPYGYRSEPVTDDRSGTIGHRRVIFEPEAAIVRRIFSLYVGEEGGRPHSPREIAHRLNQEGIAPPGARWKKRNKRECLSWSFTAIIGHRRLAKGILHNVMYTGRQLWNRSQWMRHPDTKKFRYRVRPQDEWVTHEDPSLRIVPQDLWDKAQARMAKQRLPVTHTAPPGRYLLSGLLRCGTCGGHYIITNRYMYRCGTARNRGSTVCTNGHSVSRKTIERAVIAAIREHLVTPETVAALVEEVGGQLRDRARKHEREQATNDTTTRLREVEAEIAHVKAAILVGKATKTLLEMLEEREREREALRRQ